MFETTVTIQRKIAGSRTTLTGLDGRPANDILVQVDQANDQETIEHRQITEHYTAVVYKITTRGWFATSLILQDDWLIDNVNLDPDTGNPIKYVVTGRVKIFKGDHQEVYGEVVPGNA